MSKNVMISDAVAKHLDGLRLTAGHIGSRDSYDAVLRRVLGIEQIPFAAPRAKGGKLGRPVKWPFATMAVGTSVEYPINPSDAFWARLGAAVRRASVDGKSFHVPSVATAGAVRVTRLT